MATLHLLGFPFFTLLGMVGGEKWLELELKSHNFLDAVGIPQKFKKPVRISPIRQSKLILFVTLVSQ